LTSEKLSVIAETAVDSGARAATTILNEKHWIITEAAGESGHRAITTILLPSEY
jgi:hypothetical protein